ncbi:MAG TPA: alpha/beta hydrolase [Ktedonobacterales bacterium]|nr:alpha/beta hydrolase [Ktedonobacterales bacterium]
MLAERRFDSGEVELNYAEGPDAGPPLVMVHGGASHWQGFEPIIPALAERWHVYALDLRGHGRSGWTPNRYTLDDYTADLLAFLERQVAQPAGVFGHSLGGRIALLAAARAPQAVRAVMLGDTPLSMAGMRERIVATASEADEHNARSRHPHDPTAAGTAMARDFDAIFAAWRPETVLPAVACPVLFLQADPESGGAVTDDDLAGTLQLLPDVRHARFAGVSHALWGERPGEVLATIEPFLAGMRG